MRILIAILFALAIALWCRAQLAVSSGSIGAAYIPPFPSGGGNFNTNGWEVSYAYESDLTDDTPNGRDMSNSGSLFYTNGVTGGDTAVRTILSGAYAFRANEPWMEADQFTLSVWLRVPGDGDLYTSCYQGTGAGVKSWYLRRQGSTSDRFRVGTVGDNDTLVDSVASANNSAPDSTWLHTVLIVNAGTNFSVWVNNVEVLRSTSVATNIIDSSAMFKIGGINTTQDGEYSQVDFFSRLFVTNLPPESAVNGQTNEVSMLYNGGVPATYSTVLSW